MPKKIQTFDTSIRVRVAGAKAPRSKKRTSVRFGAFCRRMKIPWQLVICNIPATFRSIRTHIRKHKFSLYTEWSSVKRRDLRTNVPSRWGFYVSCICDISRSWHASLSQRKCNHRPSETDFATGSRRRSLLFAVASVNSPGNVNRSSPILAWCLLACRPCLSLFITN